MSNQTPLAQLRDELHTKLDEVNALAAKAEQGDVLNDEELSRSESNLNEIDDLKRQIKSLELAERTKGLGKPSTEFAPPTIKVKRSATKADRDNAFRAWAMGGDATRQGIKDEWKRSADLVDANIYSNTWVTRDQTTDVEAEGKPFVNDSLFKGFVEGKAAYGGLMAAANVVTVSSAEPQHYAHDNDTANTAAGPSAQLPTVTNTSVVVDRTTITPQIFHSGVFPISLTMLRDSKVNVGEWIGRKLARRILKKMNATFTATLAAGVDVTLAGLSFNITADDLYDLYFGLDQEYVNSPRCYWMGTRATLANIVGLAVDTTGQPTWGKGLNEAPANYILGHQWKTNYDMDNFEQGVEKLPLIFGDFESMIVHTVGNAPYIRRLDELYAENLAVGFHGYWEAGAALVDPGTSPIIGMSTGTLSGDPAAPIEA